ncbi:bidirectional sugar transporter SWEET4 [Selaginella moellendorffii]|uniref:bidirectional sugar transporter SWEET4 n=1 Tax=Selaginella moellendorffii TaxID=88036 RepID=UPI000D1D051B|nr:bidirectional sugar transporter SWEET4 [Selaginella moellendorffii]|eukprot:XP_024526534.1 bidirectional sugar transporter SWEET4 [Selaginella moellendorffii]
MGLNMKMLLGILVSSIRSSKTSRDQANLRVETWIYLCRPTFWEIVRSKSTQEYSGLPYVCTLFNCMLWILYGMPFVKPHSMLIITINAAGCAIELVYTALYLSYATRAKMVYLQLSEDHLGWNPFFAFPDPVVKVLKMLGAVAVAFGLITLTTVKLADTHDERITVVGSKLVIQTRSVQYMPFLLSLFVFLNSLVWTFYAVVTRDIFIAIPNGLGCLSGIAQLSLYAIYRNSSSDNSTEENTTKTMYNNALCNIQIDQLGANGDDMKKPSCKHQYEQQ